MGICLPEYVCEMVDFLHTFQELSDTRMYLKLLEEVFKIQNLEDTNRVISSCTDSFLLFVEGLSWLRCLFVLFDKR